MILQNGNLSRCVRHPSQHFTGFCPSCLVERLSNVGTAEQCVEAPRNIQQGIVKVPDVVPNVKNKTSEAGTRRTLQYLFQLDDDLDVDGTTRSVPEKNLPSTSNACESEISSHDGSNFSKDANIKINSYGGTRMIENDSNSSEEITISTFIAKEIRDSAERQKGRGKILWFNTMFAKKRILCRTGSISKKFEIPDDKSSYLSGDKNSESYLNLWQSCDWRLCHNSSKNSWEPPRHSWDGSMLTRALSCSFSCREEGDKDLTRTVIGMHGEITGNHNQNIDKIDRFKVTANVPKASEKPISSFTETLFIERLHEESQPGDSESRIRRKKSRRLSKVWDWNLSNSFRDLVKKCDHILERSASETIHGQKSNSVESMETNGVSLNNGDCQGPVRMNQGASLSTSNADMKNLRSEWRMKNEFKLGRSRSVHYPSPGNLDYGLLRFYLTPLRSSSRCANRVRRKNTHYFGRGIFGLS